MFKNIILSLLVIFFFSTASFSNTKIYIFATVDDEIITNHDLIKESEYLKILNPNLQELNDKKILSLAKNSLIKEIIKKKEIIKLNDLNKDYSYVDEYLKNLGLLGSL